MMGNNGFGFRTKGLRQFERSMKFGSTAEVEIVITTAVFFLNVNHNMVSPYI